MTVWTIMSHPQVTVWIDLYRCIAKLPAYLMYFFPCIHVYMYFWQVNSLSRSICRQVETSCIAPLISTTDKTPQRAYLQYMTDFLLHPPPPPPHPLTILLQYLWCFYNLINTFQKSLNFIVYMYHFYNCHQIWLCSALSKYTFLESTKQRSLLYPPPHPSPSCTSPVTDIWWVETLLLSISERIHFYKKITTSLTQFVWLMGPQDGGCHWHCQSCFGGGFSQ